MHNFVIAQGSRKTPIKTPSKAALQHLHPVQNDTGSPTALNRDQQQLGGFDDGDDNGGFGGFEDQGNWQGG